MGNITYYEDQNILKENYQLTNGKKSQVEKHCRKLLSLKKMDERNDFIWK